MDGLASSLSCCRPSSPPSYSYVLLIAVATLLFSVLYLGLRETTSTCPAPGPIAASASSPSATQTTQKQLTKEWPISQHPSKCVMQSRGEEMGLDHEKEFALDQIEEFQSMLERIFFPPTRDSCENMTYMVLNDVSGAGYGSGIHGRMNMAIKALHTGRAMIDSPIHEWQFAPSHCVERSPTCFFRPWTNCTLSRDRIADAVDAAVSDLMSEKFASVPVIKTEYSWGSEKAVTRWPKFASKSVQWWKAQAIRYTMTPNRFTRNYVLDPYAKMIFPPDGEPPSDMASFFIRWGDKQAGGEDSLRPVAAYVQQLERFLNATKHTVSSIFVASDSQDAIDQMLRDHGQRYKIYSTPFPQRARDGWNDTMELKQNEQLLLTKIGIVTTVDLYIAAKALVFVGTLGSNQARMIDEIRLASGNLCSILFY